MAKKKLKSNNITLTQQELRLLKKCTLFEISWEVCNQVGGIYTVIRSKIPAVVENWQENYFLLGPFFPQPAFSEFEEITDVPPQPISNTIKDLKKEGIHVYCGRWLVTGNPHVLLFDIQALSPRLTEIKRFYDEVISFPHGGPDELLDQVLIFGFCVYKFFFYYQRYVTKDRPFLAHFHEWLAGAAIPLIKRKKLIFHNVFTTHATLLGRYIAGTNANLYEILASLDWRGEAERFNILPRVYLERLIAQEAECFTTVSEVTAQECRQFLGRSPDIITPNGLNIERFVALHEFQNLHLAYKKIISQFVMGHFFPSYGFDLDKTLYFFTAGRYEFHNKGFDLTLEALFELNKRLQNEKNSATVIMFFITKRPYHTINPLVLSSRVMFEELRNSCNAILKQIEERLLYAIACQDKPHLPILNDFVDDYWKLRLRRTLVSWKTDRLPIVVTHNLVDDQNDEILQFIRRAHLFNAKSDNVKIVYHPDFISPTNPLFGMDYGQFVRGCHLGIFPSSYEPWGYTPMECVANGIPAVTSDLSGFGDFVKRMISEPQANGIYVIERRAKPFGETVRQLADILYSFVKQTRRERITQRNVVESCSAIFDWHNMLVYYEQAYLKVLTQAKGV